MKYFFTTSIIILFLSGCATRNAFGHFNLNPAQEAAIENTRSGKIMLEDKVKGIYSVIYLNNMEKTTSKVTEEFYISLYLKDNKENDFTVVMNQQAALEIVKLQTKNKYSYLLPQERIWSSNYIVRFKKDKSKKLTLQIDSGQFSSGPLRYLKEQR